MYPPEVVSQSKQGVRRTRSLVVLPLFSGIVGAAAGLFVLSKDYVPAPEQTFPLEKTAEAPTDRQLVLLASDGRPFATRGGCYDKPVSVKELPPHFVDALLATEDRRFYSHFGLDPVGILRATRTNLQVGKVVQGGSTLTQQLAKISYFSPEKSLERKIKEAIAVFRLELALPKNEIMGRYLSRAYFGEGCFGLRAAAKYYFNKPVQKLDIGESAALVAMLKSPTQLANDAAARRERVNHVLDAMVETGRLNVNSRFRMREPKLFNRAKPTFGAYFADWVADRVDLPADGERGKLPVRTTLDRKLQRAAERSVRTIFKRFARHRKVSEAALVAMRPDGKVLAMVGGRNYRDSQFNRASQALRQPGSSFKSFVYLTAMQAGARSDMVVIDGPVTIGDWSPKNYTHDYQGAMHLQRAFTWSINTVAVKLVDAVGPNEVAKTATDLGITTPIRGNDPSLALGTSETTLVDLTSAYAAFAADAYPIRPWGIVSLGANGSRKGRPPSDAGRWRLMEGDRMREFLQATVSTGTGRGARLRIPAYGKTGTSQNYRDAWFVGFAGNLVVGVWVGNDDNSPTNRVTGGNLPAMIWRDFMNKAMAADRQFRRQVPSRIAAFRRAIPLRRDWRVASAGLKALEYTLPLYAGYPGADGAYFGNAMSFGPPFRSVGTFGQPNGLQLQPARPRKRWNPFASPE